MHCLQWYKLVLRTRLSTPAVQCTENRLVLFFYHNERSRNFTVHAGDRTKSLSLNSVSQAVLYFEALLLYAVATDSIVFVGVF